MLLDAVRRLVNRCTPLSAEEQITQDEVCRAIRALPPHFSGNDVLYELATSTWWLRSTLPTGAVTFSFWGIHRIVIAASTSETNTIADPVKEGILVVLTATSVGASGTRAMTFSTAYSSAGDTVITFSVARQTAILYSVPDKTSGGSSTGFRWTLIGGDFAPGMAIVGNTTIGGTLAVTGLLREAAGDAIAAAGTTQATGTQLTAQINTVATAAAGSGVNLPASAAGLAIVVINNGVGAMIVYPLIGATDTINGNAATVGVTLYPGTAALFTSTAAGAWTAKPLVATSAAYNTAANTTAFTATGAQLSGAAATVDFTITGTLGSGQALTLPTVAAMLAAMQTVSVGSSLRIRIINLSSANFAWTVTTNAGSGTWTLTGTMTVAQNTAREFVLTVTNVTAGTLAATLQSLGQITVAA